MVNKKSIGDLHWSKRISMNFSNEVKGIETEFLKADYSLHFVDGIFRKFWSIMDVEDSLIIQPSLFDEDKPFVLIDISFCRKNKNTSK